MIVTVPRVIGVVVVSLLGWYVFVAGPQLASPGAPESHFSYQRDQRPLADFPPTGHTFVGVQTAGGTEDFTDEERFAAATGTRPSAYSFTAGWALDDFNARAITRVAARGMLPIVTWEPWDYRSEGPTEATRGLSPAWRLARIADGQYDGYIDSWAKGVASLGYPVVIRLAHEMNGYWYPWSEQGNGNSPGDYVRMWRHVHDRFAEAGATNAIWMWSPNVSYVGSQALASLYPGDDYVDWVGLSGYYGTGGQTAYRSFDTIFATTLTQVAAITKRPVVIAETGATDATGRRADWISDLLRGVARHPEIIGMVWFEVDREIDWRIAAAPDAARAFAVGATGPRFDTPWTPYTRPRTTVP